MSVGQGVCPSTFVRTSGCHPVRGAEFGGGLGQGGSRTWTPMTIPDDVMTMHDHSRT
jgi:hypothetical protein